MKHKPDPKKPLFGVQPESQTMLTKSDRNRLIFMGVLLVGVTIAFAASVLKKSEYEQRSTEEMEARVPDQEPDAPVIAVRRFDPATIEGEVHDATNEQRVLIDQGPVAKMLDHVAGYGPGQWRGLEPERLVPSLWDEILADPAANRARPLTMRGRLVTYEERPVGDRAAWYGTLETENGTPVTFMTSSFDRSLFDVVDPAMQYAKIDALFLSVYRRADESGAWVDTPLVVGSRVDKSFPRLDGFDDEMLGSLLAAVKDDELAGENDTLDEAYIVKWLFMDRIAQGWGDEIEWEAPEGVDPAEWENPFGVRTLDGPTFEWLMEPANAQLARGAPFVLPISKNMGTRTQNAGENPARVETVTTGWIGSILWTREGSVMTYVMPGAREDLAKRGSDQLLVGRGFFVKLMAYEPSRKERRLAPLFVMQSLEVFHPEKNENVETIFWFVGGLTILLIVLIPWLVIRDRKQSERLHRELVRRKQERRRRQGSAGAAGA